MNVEYTAHYFAFKISSPAIQYEYLHNSYFNALQDFF